MRTVSLSRHEGPLSKRGPFLFLFFFILLWLPILLMWSAHASQVTVNPRSVNPYGLVLNVKYGSVTPLNPQAYASFSVNADGSIIFNTSPFENSQKVYLYNVQGYGNGTLTLKWNMGTLPTVVSAPGNAAVTQSNGPVVLTIIYTANALKLLEIDFTGLASTQIGNSAVLASIFFPIFYVAIASIFATSFFGNFFFVLKHEPPRISLSRAFGISLVVVVGWTILLLIAVFGYGLFKNGGF